MANRLSVCLLTRNEERTIVWPIRSVAGMPEAGLISLALVLTSARLPLDLLPLLLSVD